MLPYGTGICCYAFISYFNFFIASVHSFFVFSKNLVLINRLNDPQYQCVLALCAFFFFLTGAVLKGQIFQKCCV